MQKSKVIGIRFKDPLLTKIQQHDIPNAQLIRTAMQRYFLDDGKNNAVDNKHETESNNVYKQELMSTLQSQIQDLKKDKEYLQQQNNALMLSSIPLLSRIKIKLLTNKK